MKNFCVVVLLMMPVCARAQSIQVYFSPNGGCQEAVIKEIGQATQTIDIAMYYLSSAGIAKALVEAREHHVKIKIVLDQGQEIEHSSKATYLIDHGFEIRYHLGFGLMHNKFAVIDGQRLITGSFNWTRTAEESNEENLLIIDDAATVARYAQRFNYLWDTSRRDSRNATGPQAVPSWLCANFHLFCSN